jgi:hypothetical protein
MSQIRTLTLLAIAVLFLSTHSMLAGESQPKVIDPEEREHARGMINLASGQELFGDLESSRLIYYATQVVAGTNNFMVWEEPNGQFICTVVWQKLPSSDGTRAFIMTNDGRSDLLSDACTKCGAT